MAHVSDVSWPIALSLSEALRGCSRIVYFPRREVPCRACAGVGSVDGGKCSQCDGTGWAEILKRIPVDIPPLLDDPSRIRVAGAGLYGEATGGFGDLRITCHIAPQDGATLANGHLYVGLPVDPEQRARGGRFDLSVLDETITVDLQGPLAVGELYEVDLPEPIAGTPLLLVIQITPFQPASDAPAALDPAETNRLYGEAANAERSHDFGRALAAYRRLSDASPDARVLRKCGWMCLRLEDLSAAAGYMQRAVDHDPSSAEAHYYKGTVHHKRHEPLLAAVEMEYASSLGLDVKQAEAIRREALLDVFAIPAGLPHEVQERFGGLISEAVNRYYGVVAAACLDLLRAHPDAGLYYQFGAASWLESITGHQERLAEAYIGLRAASVMAPDHKEYVGAFEAIQIKLEAPDAGAADARIAAHLLQEGEARAALAHTMRAKQTLLQRGPMTDREAGTLDAATVAASAACARLVDALRPSHDLWGRALAALVSAAERIKGMTEAGMPETGPFQQRHVLSAVHDATSVGRDELLPLCAELQDHLEQRRHALPSRCHRWLETVIQQSLVLRRNLRAATRVGTTKKVAAGALDGMSVLEQVRSAVGDLRDSVQAQYEYLNGALCDTWRAWSQLLHTHVMISGHIGRDDHPDRCRYLARAVDLEQAAAAMSPEQERGVEQLRDLCRLLDDFQEAAQIAAGTQAFARAEFFQNTIDSLRGDLVPGRPLADSPQDLLNSRIELFDWACEVLFDGTASFPQEFLFDAREGSYAVTNYRLAHRQTDATTFVSIPLTSIQRYDVRASGATTRAVTLTLKDGRRITFNNVPAEHVLDRERMSWLLAAHMWETLSKAELEALEANRPAPTLQLPAEATRDSRRLLGDTRPQALSDGEHTVVCRHCGRHNFRMDRFCRDCGARIAEVRDKVQPAKDRPALPHAGRASEDGGQDALSEP